MASASSNHPQPKQAEHENESKAEITAYSNGDGGMIVKGWKATVSRSKGKVYFFNPTTGISSFEPPESELSKEQIETLRASVLGNSSSGARTSSQASGSSKQGSQSHQLQTGTAVKLPELRPLYSVTADSKRQSSIKLFRQLIKARCQEVLQGRAGHGSRFSARTDETLHYALDKQATQKAAQRAKETAHCEVLEREKLDNPMAVCGLGSDVIVCAGLEISIASMWCGRWIGESKFPRDEYMLRLPPTDKFWRYFIYEEAEELELITKSAGVGDERHVIIYHPDHPPPEQREEEEEDKVREEATAKLRKEQEQLMLQEKERKKKQKQEATTIRETMNEHAQQAEPIKPMFPRRDKRSVSQVQKELREKKRTRESLTDDT